MSTNRRPLLDIGLLYGVQQYTVPGRLPPAAPGDSPDVICPPRSGPTYAAFIRAGSPFQHLKTPTSIGSICPAHFSFATRYVAYVLLE
ncbi:jg27936 [Pararge aegeria aegeria]|uniref:Jg27936 protein n=1 Tax=Pararge aegeria aegeria TaxID=348720 RepID=A0A8S4R4N9_9NEOP|nr:jg27936 [Pararge aegeria aegeria]